MQVLNNPQLPTEKPNFKAIKSVKTQGLYKKHPELAQKLVDTFQTNKKALEFCKKHDVDIILNAYQDTMQCVNSAIALIFKNPAKSKFLGLFQGAKDSIIINGFGNNYDKLRSLIDSTNDLMRHIMNGNDSKDATGILEGNIEYTEKIINEFLKSKAEIEGLKARRSIHSQLEADRIQSDSESLQDSIDELIKKSE